MLRKAKKGTQKILILFLGILLTMLGCVTNPKHVQAAQNSNIKINCGGADYTDSTNSVFPADNSYSGGSAGSKTDNISDTSDASLYKSYRYGNNFSYNIPVENGNYVVNLKFVEPYWTASGKRVFDVEAEDSVMIDNLDIYSQAGKFKAYDRSFRVTVKDQQLNLNFIASADNAVVSAIAVYPDNSVFGVAATPFLLESQSNVSNVKLQWSEVPGATRYDISRSVNGSSYSIINSLSGTSIDDYDLSVGTTYKYEVKAYCDSSFLTTAYSEECKTYTLPSGLNTYDNTIDDTLVKPNEIKVGSTYYRFNLVNKTSPEKGFKEFVMQTSTDDINYGNDKVVLSYTDAPDLNNCKLECITFVYNLSTNKIILWAHYENNADYTLARLAVATATPGEKFVYSKSFRPFNNQSRDMSVYIDDDKSAYIISSANNNADMILYKLTSNWEDVESQVSTIYVGMHREAPSMIKKDGTYYLFTSQPAGWYPSKSMYSSAASISGKWSEMRAIGNSSTFSSQSGQVARLKQGNGNNYAMMANRWMFGWKDAIDRTQYQRMLPISFSNGYAFFDFYKNVMYSAANDIMIPVQSGKLLSQGKKSTSSSNLNTADKANDGNYYSEWVATNAWPSTWTVDLSKPCSLSEIQISWWMMKGSEAYHQYKVEGSTDGTNFTLLLDKSTGYNDYGFTTNSLSGTARYIRVTLVNAKIMNNTSNWYTPQLYEVKVFGK